MAELTKPKKPMKSDINNQQQLWYLFSVESPAPSKSSLNVISGPTHITLDWGAPQEGWMTSYKVHVEPAKV